MEKLDSLISSMRGHSSKVVNHLDCLHQNVVKSLKGIPQEDKVEFYIEMQSSVSKGLTNVKGVVDWSKNRDG